MDECDLVGRFGSLGQSTRLAVLRSLLKVHPDGLNAGDIARRFYGGDYKRWSKEGGSPVTEADLAVNSFLRDRLTAARPDIVILCRVRGVGYAGSPQGKGDR